MIIKNNTSRYLLAVLISSFIVAIGLFFLDNHKKTESAPGISYSHNLPQYWQYHGKPVLLLGGAEQSNPFLSRQMKKQLDRLQSAGGNFLVNVLSSRNLGDPWPFKQRIDGRFNLEQWNEKYWRKLEQFFQAASQRDMIIQLVLWDPYDFYRDAWNHNPFNPQNNINYNQEQSRLPMTIPDHPINTENPFFQCIPAKKPVPVVLKYQAKFINKVLSYSLNYDNIIYCIDKHTTANARWGMYWADHLRTKAAEKNKDIHITETWYPKDPDHPLHNETIHHPEIYSYIDYSGNDHFKSDIHWKKGLERIQKLEKAGLIRPVNSSWVYGSKNHDSLSTQNALDAFCLNVLLGNAAVSFDSQPFGPGLNTKTQKVIQSIRLISQSMPNFFKAHPNNNILLDRQKNEAYCRHYNQEAYLIYFPGQGNIQIDFSGNKYSYAAQWLKLTGSKWKNTQRFKPSTTKTFQTPGNGKYFLLIEKR